MYGRGNNYSGGYGEDGAWRSCCCYWLVMVWYGGGLVVVWWYGGMVR